MLPMQTFDRRRRRQTRLARSLRSLTLSQPLTHSVAEKRSAATPVGRGRARTSAHYSLSPLAAQSFLPSFPPLFRCRRCILTFISYEFPSNRNCKMLLLLSRSCSCSSLPSFTSAPLCNRPNFSLSISLLVGDCRLTAPILPLRKKVLIFLVFF